MKLVTLMFASILAWPACGAVPASPLSLCIDDQCPDVADGVKWNPGHYMLPNLGDTQAQRFSYYDADLVGNPSLLGAQVRFYWADLEPVAGRYDFSSIEKELAKLQSMQKRLWIQIMDRKFYSSSSSGIIPDDMLTSAYSGGVVQTNTGFAARLWDPKVMDRKIALLKALAERFDKEPYIEAITGAETAMGLNAPLPDGYSPTALAVQLKREIAAMTAAFRHTNVLVYTNFLGTDQVMTDLVRSIHSSRAGAGGPDTLPPPRDGTQGQRTIQGVIGGTDYRGKMPVGQSVQSPELGGKEGNWTPAQLLVEGVDELGATHMSWSRKIGTPGTTWAEIKSYLRSNARINRQCPESYKNACDTN